MADNNSELLEHFALPRLDWYDDKGRINKDALIDNFNAIEAKLNEISRLSAFSIEPPDFTKIQIDDTTLDSADNAIINLKSFIDIMQLKNIPITFTVNGTIITLLQYYDNNYNLVTIRDKKIEGLATDNNCWVYLNPDTKDIYVTTDNPKLSTDVFLGCYSDSRLYHVGGVGLMDINILEPLSKMSRTTNVTQYNRDTNVQARFVNGRLYGYYGAQSNGNSRYVRFQDQGF